MKLIIEISEEDYAETMYRKQHTPTEMDWADRVIANGTPLDGVKAEIQNIYVGYRQGYEIMADVLAVFDKHISEDKADEKPREYCGDDEHCRTCKYRFYTPKNDMVCLNCHGGESYQPDEKCADISGKEN